MYVVEIRYIKVFMNRDNKLHNNSAEEGFVLSLFVINHL